MPYPLTDLGNSQRFVALYGDIARYSNAHGWMIYTGKVWEASSILAQGLAVKTVESIKSEATEGDDSDASKATLSWYQRSQAFQRIEAILKIARSHPRMSVRSDEFNLDPYLLNLQNGTMDLRTRKLQPHNPADMITRICNVAHDSDAKCPMFEKFMGQVMMDNKPKIESLQLIMGYTLTGDTSERKIFIFHGVGKNGKSVFLDTLSEIMGSYATQAPTTVLMTRDHSDATNDLAALHDKRFVTTSETEATQRMAESVVKAITGDRKISARFLFKEYFEYKPQFKAFLATNHPPIIRGAADPALWARIVKVNWDYIVPESEMIPNLDIKLYKEEAAGIFNWMLDGCLAFQAAGKLNLAQEIAFDTDDYRAEQDIIQHFIDDRIQAVSGFDSSVTQIYEAYRTWCDDTGHRPLAQNKLTMEMMSRGFVKKRASKGMFFSNIGVVLPQTNTY